MKLILTAAVENLGVPGDIVEVKDGYGRNYLLPRGMAIVATRGAEKQIEDIKRVRSERQIQSLDHAREVKEQIEALDNITVTMRTSSKGKLFGSVQAGDIVRAIEAAGGPKIEKQTITVPKGLVKSTGGYQVIAQLHDDISAKVNFKVVAA
ncbi:MULTISPECIES: 50S ribosomal protein L9 [Corynebacterium]|uniref:50S ribosomal protein L9 n=1 Tax=Corynebacterium TaxID=1716 RepID=UPI00124D9461|nr:MULTISPECIES: 50S ribosomal protein L9 [Corynebacterium]